MNILHAIRDPNVFGLHFKDADTWVAWCAFLAALFALPMTEEELAIYRKHTGRSAPPAEPLSEAWLVCGRRAGKSFVLAVIAVFLACFRDWRPFLGPGEAGTIMIIARDRRQARVIKRYVLGLLQAVPMLRRQIEREDAEGITLRNQRLIEIHTASFPRGARLHHHRCACSTSLRSGRPTKQRRSPTPKCSTRCAPAWPPFPAPCCCARRHRTRGGARCGTRTAGTLAGTATRCWSGRPPPAT